MKELVGRGGCDKLGFALTLRSYAPTANPDYGPKAVFYIVKSLYSEIHQIILSSTKGFSHTYRGEGPHCVRRV